MGKLQRQLEARLTLYVRQLAWYHATPKPDHRRGKSGKGTEPEAPPQLSRIEQAKRDKIDPQMPPNPAPHITDRLVEIGLTEAAGMGAVPITWREIQAWRENVGVWISPWEARLLRRLSAAYLAELRKAERPTCPPPWRIRMTKRHREIEDTELRSVLG